MYSDEDIHKMMKKQMKIAGAAVFVFFVTFVIWFLFGKH